MLMKAEQHLIHNGPLAEVRPPTEEETQIHITAMKLAGKTPWFPHSESEVSTLKEAQVEAQSLQTAQ